MSTDNNSNDLFNSGAKPLFGNSSAQNEPKPLFGPQTSEPKPFFSEPKPQPPPVDVISPMPDEGPKTFVEQPQPAPVPEFAEIPPAENETRFIPVPDAPPVEEPIEIQTPVQKDPVNEFGMPAVITPQDPVMTENLRPEQQYKPASPATNLPKKTAKTLLAVSVETASLGEIMRSAREASGHSMEDIFESTRISSKYVQAIENETYKDLPQGSFPSAYIRTLAKFYNLEDSAIETIHKKIKENLKSKIATAEVVPHLETSARVNEAEEKRIQKLFILFASGIVVIIIAIVFAIVGLVYLFRSDSGSDSELTAEVSIEKMDFSRKDMEKLSAPRMPVMRELRIPVKENGR